MAVFLAEQRFMARLHEDSPAHKGVLSVRAFWSAMWDAVAALPPQPAPVPLWHLAVA
jgi:hypothetical protein